jgi:hypothetical protein
VGQYKEWDLDDRLEMVSSKVTLEKRLERNRRERAMWISRKRGLGKKG